MDKGICLSNSCLVLSDLQKFKPQTHLVSNCWLLEQEVSGRSAECPAFTCVDQRDVLANLPSVIHQMRSVGLEPQSAGSPFAIIDVKSNLLSQQLSTSIKKSCVHLALEQMRAKHRAEVPDSCSALPQLIRRCSDLNPEVVIALQVDEQDCLMRLFVTTPPCRNLLQALSPNFAP
jgi:hypothetical protein